MHPLLQHESLHRLIFLSSVRPAALAPMHMLEVSHPSIVAFRAAQLGNYHPVPGGCGDSQGRSLPFPPEGIAKEGRAARMPIAEAPPRNTRVY